MRTQKNSLLSATRTSIRQKAGLSVWECVFTSLKNAHIIIHDGSPSDHLENAVHWNTVFTSGVIYYMLIIIICGCWHFPILVGFLICVMIVCVLMLCTCVSRSPSLLHLICLPLPPLNTEASCSLSGSSCFDLLTSPWWFCTSGHGGWSKPFSLPCRPFSYMAEKPRIPAHLLVPSVPWHFPQTC